MGLEPTTFPNHRVAPLAAHVPVEPERFPCFVGFAQAGRSQDGSMVRLPPDEHKRLSVRTLLHSSSFFLVAARLDLATRVFRV